MLTWFPELKLNPGRLVTYVMYFLWRKSVWLLLLQHCCSLILADFIAIIFMVILPWPRKHGFFLQLLVAAHKILDCIPRLELIGHCDHFLLPNQRATYDARYFVSFGENVSESHSPVSCEWQYEEVCCFIKKRILLFSQFIEEAFTLFYKVQFKHFCAIYIEIMF